MLKRRVLIVYIISTMLALSIGISAKADEVQTFIDKENGVKFEFTSEHFVKPWITDENQIKERTSNISKGIFDAYAKSKTNNLENVDKYLKSQGFDIINPAGIIEDSVSDEVNIYEPSVYYDPATGLYVLNASFKWKRDSGGIPYWRYDLNAPGSVGGLDGIGLWIGNPAGITLQSNMYLVTYDYNLSQYKTSTPWNWNQYGVAFKSQDKCWYDNVPGLYNYNWDSGTLVVWISVSGTGSTYLKTTLGHDWNTTQLQSVSISSSGLSFSFGTGNNYWQGTSLPYTWSR
ncbi:MAG: hypothetical protein PWQ59_1157 [Thermoanaerobacterium sp.]|nr:hypothetical protein [Thermoanaerobacterium sp.]